MMTLLNLEDIEPTTYKMLTWKQNVTCKTMQSRIRKELQQPTVKVGHCIRCRRLSTQASTRTPFSTSEVCLFKGIRNCTHTEANYDLLT